MGTKILQGKQWRTLVPIVPGTNGVIIKEASDFVEQIGYPVIVKATAERWGDSCRQRSTRFNQSD